MSIHTDLLAKFVYETFKLTEWNYSIDDMLSWDKDNCPFNDAFFNKLMQAENKLECIKYISEIQSPEIQEKCKDLSLLELKCIVDLSPIYLCLCKNVRLEQVKFMGLSHRPAVIYYHALKILESNNGEIACDKMHAQLSQFQETPVTDVHLIKPFEAFEKRHPLAKISPFTPPAVVKEMKKGLNFVNLLRERKYMFSQISKVGDTYQINSCSIDCANLIDKMLKGGLNSE